MIGKMYRYKMMLLLTLFMLYLSRIEAVLTPEDECFFGHEADRYDWSKHPCRRDCKNNEQPKECHYVFVVEIYSTMSKACYDCPFNKTDCFRPHCLPGDGVQKPVYVVNRQLPGTSIEVCKNDRIVVDVRNAMLSESTVIHWHGIHQSSSPYMDGVPYVTQCPILPGNSFRYVFNANKSGTYFYHGHIGTQRDDGLVGSLIVRSSPKENVHKKLYDYDNQIMIINDWADLGATAGFLKDYHAGSQTLADTVLINGLGRFKKIERENTTSQYVPSTVFQVKQNRRYRFRVISTGGSDCPFEVSIDNHTMLVISADANDIQPVEVDAFYIWNGERVDVIINANQKIDNYWIRYRGFGTCAKRGTTRPGVYQVSILRYEGAKLIDPESPIGYDIPVIPDTARIFNPHNKGSEDPRAISLPVLNSIAKNDETLRNPDYQFHMTYDFYQIDNYDFHRRHLYGFNEVLPKFKIMSLQLNHIGLKLPSFPPLSQPDMVKDNTFCNATTLKNKNCTVDECVCTHVLQVKLNSVVELVMIDEGQSLKALGVFNHPLHLHGYSFRVIAMEKLEQPISIDLVKKLDREGKIKRKLDHAPLKDTVKVPTNGYTIVRFYANNPGYWLYHCHIDTHTNIGMALIFKVGEHKDFPPKPKNFPTCGNFS